MAHRVDDISSTQVASNRQRLQYVKGSGVRSLQVFNNSDSGKVMPSRYKLYVLNLSVMTSARDRFD